jgi:two-component system sensor histidine kinase QseC
MKLSIKSCILLNTLLSIVAIMTIAIGANYILDYFFFHNTHASLITFNKNQFFVTITLCIALLAVAIWIIASYSMRGIKKLASDVTTNTGTCALIKNTNYNYPKELIVLTESIDMLRKKITEHAEKDKKFAADAAHELRTPLAVVNTHAQVALGSESLAECKEELKSIIAGMQRSTHIVNQLLNLSRTNPDVVTQTEAVDLHLHTQNIMADLAPKAIEKNIEIELHAKGKIIITANPTSIEILIRNIIDNAINYTPRGGRVIVRINKQDLYIIFSVQDNGLGIPKELRERVFDRFFRIDTNAAEGSGLGLGIVKQIAQIHHAQIELNTPPAGKGLLFNVKFPIPTDSRLMNLKTLPQTKP